MIVYEYKGGGYDGCWWEWNFFGIHEKKFYNIITSGRKGVKSEQDAKDLLNSEARFFDTSVSTYNLDIEQHHTEFVNGMVASTARDIDKYLRDNDLGKLHGHCYLCGETYDVKDMDPDDYGAAGGTSYFAKNLYCRSCAMNEVNNERERADS